MCLSRSKSLTYPEYHTSLDDLNCINPTGLYGAYDVIKDCLYLIENNYTYKLTCLGEPQLGKRGLYPQVGTKSIIDQVKTISNLIAEADGENDVIDISNKINIPTWDLYPLIDKLMNANLLIKK